MPPPADEQDVQTKQPGAFLPIFAFGHGGIALRTFGLVGGVDRDFEDAAFRRRKLLHDTGSKPQQPAIGVSVTRTEKARDLEVADGAAHAAELKQIAWAVAEQLKHQQPGKGQEMVPLELAAQAFEGRAASRG